MRRGNERAIRDRLALRNVEGNLAFTAGEVWAWFVLPTQPWSFRTDGQREQQVVGLADALAWLAGHRVHLRVTTKPYATHEWARGLASITPRPIKTPGQAGWGDHLVAMQQHLRHQTMSEKLAFLGVRVSNRAATHRLISSVFRHPGDMTTW